MRTSAASAQEGAAGVAGVEAIERACAALVLRLAWLADHDEAPLAIGLLVNNGERT